MFPLQSFVIQSSLLIYLSTMASQPEDAKVKTPIYLAIDLEVFGPRICDEVVAVGVCLGDHVGNVIEKKTWCVKTDTAIHPAAKPFWDHNKNVLDGIRKHAQNVEDVWPAIATWLDKKREEYSDLIIVSDNPGFDIYRFNVAIERFADRPGIQYTKDCDYCFTVDPSERLAALPIVVREDIANTVDRIANVTHWPEDDAYHHYVLCVLVQRSIDEMDRSQLMDFDYPDPPLPPLVFFASAPEVQKQTPIVGFEEVELPHV